MAARPDPPPAEILKESEVSDDAADSKDPRLARKRFQSSGDAGDGDALPKRRASPQQGFRRIVAGRKKTPAA
jgi:hypothetical protein